MKKTAFFKRPGTWVLLAFTLGIFLLTQSFGVALVFFLTFGAPLYFMEDLPAYATTMDKIGKYIFLLICSLIFLFLITPILIIIPLSFNAEPYFTFTEGMLSLDPSAYSLRWYADIFRFGSTIIATFFGTLAALGLSRPEMPYRAAITSLLISPMIVPLVITATGMFFFYSQKDLFPFFPDGLAKTYFGIILAHATLGIPFVIITVTATLSGFDRSLIRASQGLGASGTTTFFKVIMPLILPGMISGALFAFITSMDEVVAVIFLADVDQRTIPRQMFSGIREQISPTILAVATILVVISVGLLSMLEILRRRSERLRGLAPQ